MLLALLSTSALASETITYTYDVHGRLTGVLHSGSVNNGGQSTISYDAADNRTNYAVDTGASGLSIADASVTEGGALIFTVTRTGSTNASVTVNYSTGNNTAVAGSDYVATSGTLTFGSGETSKTISVATIDDGAPEPTETMFVNLSGATGGGSVTRGQASGTIADNDVTPVSFAVGNAPTVTEGGALVFTVTKSGSTYLNTSISYATADGSATTGADYTPTSGTLTFAPSETSKTVSVATIDDRVTEPTKTMYLNLSSPNGGAIAVGQGAGSINDNDTGPVTPLNPTLNYSQDTGNFIAITTLVIVNGNPLRITSFAVPSGYGSASIAADGQSVQYNAEHVGTAAPCEPAGRDTFTVPYVVQNTSTGVNTSGTATISVKGLPGPKGVCQ